MQGSFKGALCAVCVLVYVKEPGQEDLRVDCVCSRSRGELSAWRLSLLQSAPVSYPVSEEQEVSQHISDLE